MMRQSLFFAATAALFIVSSARAEAPYAFRERLECVHQPGMRQKGAKCAVDELEIKNGFTIALSSNASDYLMSVARDFEDYLYVSMGVEAHVTKGSVGSGSGANLAVKPLLGAGAQSLSVVGERIMVNGGDERALAQALYHLEDVMNLRGGPFLKRGSFSRKSRFDVRMSHSGYGNDIFPEPHLNQMAHFGITAILVFLDDVDKTKAQDYQDLKALIRRAKKYGLDTYLYSYIPAFFHPDDGTKPFDDAYGRIAGYYPEAKGIILVGESCQFPSKDPRVQPRTWKMKKADPRPEDKRPLSGWFPCSDYPAWVQAVEDAIHRKAPKQELVFWTYNWGWAPAEDRMKLIDALPKDVALMATFEMFERRKLSNGFETPTADYTISVAGPGKYFVSEAERAKKAGLRLYTQANAAGLTWDFGTIPYEPFPMQWQKRWNGMVKANKDWGLTGVMENHHFGWWPSFIAELEKEVYTEGGIPFDEHLSKILARDYGKENVNGALEIFKKWSEDIVDYSPSDINQYGPFRIGPAYPFAFGKDVPANKDFPGLRYASNAPADITRFDYLKEGYVPTLTPERNDNEFLKAEIILLKKMAANYERGEEYFRDIATRLDGYQRNKALSMADLAGYLKVNVKTAINVKEGAIAFREGNRAQLLKIAKEEYRNATEALQYVERDSRLGWEPSMEYAAGPEQIRWKLELMVKTYGEGVEGK